MSQIPQKNATRHSWGEQWLNPPEYQAAGATVEDVAHQLGHAKVDTTLANYARPEVSRLKAIKPRAVAKLSPKIKS